MFNKNTFSGLVYVAKELHVPKDNFGYAFVVNAGRDENSKLFIKVILKDKVLERGQSGFFKKGSNLYVTGTLENSVYEDKSTLVLQLHDFAGVNLYRENPDKANGSTSPVTAGADGVPF